MRQEDQLGLYETLSQTQQDQQKYPEEEKSARERGGASLELGELGMIPSHLGRRGRT